LSFVRVPVAKVDLTDLIVRRRRRKRETDSDNFFDEEEFDQHLEPSDPSVDFYPEPYCTVVESKDKL